MHNYRFFLFLLFFCCLGITGLQAQEAVSASGGEASGTGGTVSFTAGLSSYSTLSGTGGLVTEGVQQPFTIKEVTGLEEPGISLSCSVFPNPATNRVTLKIVNRRFDDLEYRLFDLNGRLLDNRKIGFSETLIGLNGYGSTVYMLKVSDNLRELKTFLIIKN